MNLLELGHRLHSLRRQRKLTQEELAKRVGKTKSYISAIELARPHPSSKQPRQPTREVVEKLATALNDDLDTLLLLAGHSPHRYNVIASSRPPEEETNVRDAVASVLPLLQHAVTLLGQMQERLDRMEARLAQPLPPASKETGAEEEKAGRHKPATSPASPPAEIPRQMPGAATVPLTSGLPSDVRWRTYTLDFGSIRLPVGQEFRRHIQLFTSTRSSSVEIPIHVHHRLRLLGASRVTLSELFLYGLLLIDARLLDLPEEANSEKS